MARLITSGFELNSKTVGIELDAVSTAGAVSLDTATVRSGTYSLKCTAAAQTASVAYTAKSTAATIPGYCRTYFRPSATTNTNTLILRLSNGGTSRGGVNWTTSNTLQLINASGAQIGSDTPSLTNGNWYRIELSTDGGNLGTLTARYVDCGTSGVDPGNGTETTIASGANSTNSSWTQFRVGFVTACTATAYFDDVAVNDNTGSFQNSYPGSGKVIVQRPDSTGDANGFLVNVGGTAGVANNFTRVNEVTPDSATTYNASAVLNAEDLFNCGASGLTATDTINVVGVGIQAANTVAADATAAYKLEILKTSGGTKSQSAAVIPNSTTFSMNNSAVGASLLYLTTYQDPDSANWTNSTLDTMQVGYTESAANVQSIAISNVYAIVDYTPLVIGSKSSSLLMMGVG